MLDRLELEAILSGDHGIRQLECKAPGDLSTKSYVAKVARAAMAMGNLRDGGAVCIGVADNMIADMQPGLSDAQFADWSNNDNVADALGRYTDPPVAFHVDPWTLSSGAKIVLLQVSEFADVPHICKRDFPGELQAGHLYVRPRSKVESVTVPTVTDMRDVLDIATDKGVRDFVGRMRSAGLLTHPEPEASNNEQFDVEAEDFWAQTSDVVDTISRVGHFDVSIRPEPYQDRMAANELTEFITTRAVSMRGWPVPYVSWRGATPLQNHGTWVGQDDRSNVVPHIEAWRFASSGQFAQRRVLGSDFDTDHQLLADNLHGGTVLVWDVLLYLVEVAELGARIATKTECEAVTFVLALSGIEGRSLHNDAYGRGFAQSDPISTNRISARRTVDTPRLLHAPRVVGRELAQSLLRQFGVSVPDQVLDEMQAEIFNS